MSALGHYLEEEGIATVAIALIRPQAENTKPPRALWVPFELGRPFGPPSDPAFQKRVLLAALHMLVEGGRPVRIVDFPDDVELLQVRRVVDFGELTVKSSWPTDARSAPGAVRANQVGR